MLKLVTRPTLPRAGILDHYKQVLDEAHQALAGLDTFGKTREELLPAAMRAAEFEARHTGPLQLRGKQP